jgi:hypothetical protein
VSESKNVCRYDQLVELSFEALNILNIRSSLLSNLVIFISSDHIVMRLGVDFTFRPCGHVESTSSNLLLRELTKMLLAMVTPATAPILELRYNPELAIAISDSSTVAARSTKTAELAIPVAKPPKKTKSACQIDVSLLQVRRRRVKQSMAERPERIMGRLYRPVLMMMSESEPKYFGKTPYRLT